MSSPYWHHSLFFFKLIYISELYSIFCVLKCFLFQGSVLYLCQTYVAYLTSTRYLQHMLEVAIRSRWFWYCPFQRFKRPLNKTGSFCYRTGHQKTTCTGGVCSISLHWRTSYQPNMSWWSRKGQTDKWLLPPLFLCLFTLTNHCNN